MTFKKLLILTLLILMILLPAYSLAEYVVVTHNSLHLREKASLSSENLHTYPKGSVGCVIDEENGFYHVLMSDNKEGYFKGNYVKVLDDIQNEGSAKIISTKPSVNLREKPELNSKSMGKVAKNTPVQIIEKENDMYYLVYVDGRIGYLHENYLTDIAETPATPSLLPALSQAQQKEAQKSVQAQEIKEEEKEQEEKTQNNKPDTSYKDVKKRVIDPSQPMVALTFDDGPSENTEKILDVLKEYGQTATFCVQGKNIEPYKDLIIRMAEEGHEIATHTWSHRNLTKLSASSIRDDLSRCLDLTEELTGKRPTALRPPYGAVNANVKRVCKELGLTIFTWDIDTLDWSKRNTSTTYNTMVRKARNGGIILCHDLYSTTANAIEKALPVLIEKGFQIVSLEEMFSFHKDGVSPGKVYYKLDPKNILTE